MRRRSRQTMALSFLGMTGVIDHVTYLPAGDGVIACGQVTYHRQLKGSAPDQRIVVILRYTEGLSYEQIADILGCSTGTVASRLNRAHKLLERRLSRLQEVRS